MRNDDEILLAHGSGGASAHRLVKGLFMARLGNPILDALDDAADLLMPSLRLAFTTDSYVVKPLFFPGGDIGRLAICGTVNDLAMKGARPLYLSASFIIEEGMKLSILENIVDSMARTAREAGVMIVAGDTKVVERGGADGLFITTSGVGVIEGEVDISGGRATVGDIVIVSGTLGDHGVAVMVERDSLGLEAKIQSDCAPLGELVGRIIEVCPETHVLRDPTRGGLATTLNEIAEQSQVGILVDENAIPVRDEVSGVCGMLGLDPLYVANEGKLVAFIPQEWATVVLGAMRESPLGRDATPIGKVVADLKGVYMKTIIGGTRPLLLLEGDQLPRIC